MSLGKRAYWVAALVAVLALAGTAVTLTSHFAAAGGSGTATCNQQETEDGNGPDTGLDDAGAVADAPDAAGEVEDGSGPEANADDAGEADCSDEATVAAGTLDDGKELLPQASISIDAAIASAQAAASGAIGEIDLEQYQGKLVFNVDVGDKDVKVDASNGAVLSATSDD